ncbi:hypothetical protein BDN71DRAFT_1457380 [Pleurotus eryngii]|uniref:Secreted protein n=1 Tax=Pleurotus eryngii TaxID=5323 RepID=A0A9P5ZLA8_PLEER|nr:hypothetical protein BDN71DRAFT_1457380 [Pleurotus eryngii]
MPLLRSPHHLSLSTHVIFAVFLSTSSHAAPRPKHIPLTPPRILLATAPLSVVVPPSSTTSSDSGSLCNRSSLDCSPILLLS